MVTNLTAINERMCHLRLKKAEERAINITNIHAPTEEREEEEKDALYEILEEFYDKLLKYELHLIFGDSNAKLGKEGECTSTIGKFSKHDISNNNGRKLIGWAAGKNCKIMSTYFQHKKIHMGTWEAPDGNTVDKIDHVVVPERYSHNIKDVRAFRGAEIHSDHRLVRIKTKFKRIKGSYEKTKRVQRFKIESLHQGGTTLRYQEQLKQNIEKSEEAKTIGNQWKTLENTILAAAKKQ